MLGVDLQLELEDLKSCKGNVDLTMEMKEEKELASFSLEDIQKILRNKVEVEIGK